MCTCMCVCVLCAYIVCMSSVFTEAEALTPLGLEF